ncbi:hypothetical protein [Phenylobacterium sp.]|jgi:hypothetical protein|uniref:hypothetical protein n=1 Tax=Phenylobacterium sp. TaxID=1871053 RepID=UPI002E2FF468|nr:hypothetical protein [Phenylobacterium sp.]HEX3367294.1 hypothetical protein [Phenylobacterium sp.]
MPTEAGPRKARDFGAVRRYGLAHVIGAIVVVGAAALLVTSQAVRDRNAAIALAKKWDIQGPPCPAMSETEFNTKHEVAPKTFDYDGVTLGRIAGDVSCSDVKDDGGRGFGTDKVCQFTSPAALTVASPAGRFFFVPGPGQPATLRIHKNVATCVMASKFTLQTE